MAPKRALRRPAAAKARLARPAAAIPRPPAAAAVKQLHELDLMRLQGLQCIYLKDALYYGRAIEVCGTPKGLRMEEGEYYMQMKILGTKDDVLLRSLTGKSDRLVDVHICGPGCAAALTGEFVLHGKSYEVSKDKEAWFTNVEEVVVVEPGPDELARLRAAARLEEEPADEGRPPGGETPKGKKRKKEKTKRKTENKAKKDEREKEGKAAVEDESEEEEIGKKSLEAMYEGTGLDPSAKRRKSFLKKARRLAKGKKKKKKKNDSDSESSSSDSTSSTSSGGQGGLFTSEKKVKQVWRKYPGALTAVAVSETKSRLLTSAGNLWSEDRKSLPPLFCQYARQNLLPHMAPAMGQEVISISTALDLLLEGRPSASADILSQRLKALEGLSRGSHWSMTRQFELVRIDQPGIADEAEAYQAAKYAKEEEKIRSLMSRSPGGKGGDTGTGGSGKGKRGKEGKGSGKYKGDDSGKGKGGTKRDDKNESWQKKDK